MTVSGRFVTAISDGYRNSSVFNSLGSLRMLSGNFRLM